MFASTTDAPQSDEELAELAARREPGGGASNRAADAYTRLYDRHSRPILAFLAARTRRDELDDLSQEIWRRVWERLPKAEGFRGRNFRAWVFEIARNLLIDQGRKKRPEPIGDGEPFLVDGRIGAVDSGLIERERAEGFRRCLDRLPPDAAALIRARLGGEDYESVRTRLGWTANLAYKRFHAAKEQLKKCLERALT
jgi:RNA polymerase sigma-70 factor (ECF subfamily)